MRVQQASAQCTVPKEADSRGALESLEAAHHGSHTKTRARKMPKLAQQGQGELGSIGDASPVLRAGDATSAIQAADCARGANPAANGPTPEVLERTPAAAHAVQVEPLSR